MTSPITREPTPPEVAPTNAGAAPAVRLEALTLSHRRHAAVQQLTGRFEAGSLTAIVGPNGAGKSSLMEAIAGRLAPVGGSVDIDPALRRSIAYLPQQSQVDRSFPLDALDLVLLGHWARVGAWRGASAGLVDAGRRALAAVGLGGVARRLIGELSAGQLQRVLFARVLLQDARLILLDEPFNAVDARTTADLLALVAGWHAEGRTVIAVLHDLAQVRGHFPEALLLARGAIGWGATADVLSVGNLERARRVAEGWDADAAALTPALSREREREQEPFARAQERHSAASQRKQEPPARSMAQDRAPGSLSRLRERAGVRVGPGANAPP